LLTPSPVVLATLSLHDALPICIGLIATHVLEGIRSQDFCGVLHELATFVIGHPTICKECEKSGLKVRILAEVIGLDNFVHDIPLRIGGVVNGTAVFTLKIQFLHSKLNTSFANSVLERIFAILILGLIELTHIVDFFVSHIAILLLELRVNSLVGDAGTSKSANAECHNDRNDVRQFHTNSPYCKISFRSCR